MYRKILSPVVVFAVLISGCGDYADLPRSSQTVDDVTIYLGVMPARLVQGHSTVPGGPQALHGGTAQNRASHHIVVALFDAKTGARITDARIRAGVGDRSYNAEHGRSLEPMQIAGMMSYGNFFLMEGGGTWRIHLEIFLAGASRPIEADFAYAHVPDR
jgi:hypothetical protein